MLCFPVGARRPFFRVLIFLFLAVEGSVSLDLSGIISPLVLGSLFLLGVGSYISSMLLSWCRFDRHYS